MINLNSGIEMLKQSKSIEQWNNTRSFLKNFLSMKEIIGIDSSGLIIQVLGADKVH